MACEAYIAAKRLEGWTCLPDRYDDGGYSGGNLKRPAFQRLMDDVRAGCVDMIVCYKCAVREGTRLRAYEPPLRRC